MLALARSARTMFPSPAGHCHRSAHYQNRFHLHRPVALTTQSVLRTLSTISTSSRTCVSTLATARCLSCSPGTGAHEWENPNLEHFLDALHGFLADLDGYYAGRGQQPPAQPDWGLFATVLAAATGYE